ncbi:MDR family MFS transporter [Pseudofulvibacter geojedonensis]|uniref:MDR family MFS transporter n=1 Tax=Pseudofulvibacter geojedonensis TaxID=1123758 RepID=A0ABW3I2V5_9FLAO
MKKLYLNYIDSFSGLSKEVWWLSLITLINRAGTMVIPFLSLYLTESLDFTPSNVGWIMSAFGLGSAAGSWLGGKLTDKIGYYKVMLFSLLLTGLLFIGLQFLTTFSSFCLGIFIVMTVADTFRPAMFVALSAYSKPENKTRSVTLIRLAINLGFSAGPAVGGLIITYLSYGGLFWVDGITCALASILLLKVLNPKKAIVIDEEKVINPKSAYTDKTFWVFLVAMSLFGIVFMQFFSTIPLYYKNIHFLSEFQIGLLMGMNGSIIFVLEMPVVKWLEKTKRSKSGLMLIGAILTGLSFIILTTTSWVGILVISMLLVTIGEMIAFPFSNAFAMDRSKRGNKGEYMALYSIAFSIAHIFSHNGGMHLIEYIGYNNTWYIITAISTICILLLYILRQRMKLKSIST